MTLEEMEKLLYDAMLKAAVSRPETIADEALWVQTTTIYLIELFKRAKLKGMSVATCQRTAIRATKQRVKEEKVLRVLAVELENE